MAPQRKIDRALQQMRATPSAVSFRDLDVVCRHFFGEPRVAAGIHCIYATPWRGDPRVNIQNDHGRAKAYQVRQVLAAIDRLTEGTEHRGTEGDHA